MASTLAGTVHVHSTPIEAAAGNLGCNTSRLAESREEEELEEAQVRLDTRRLHANT